MSNYRKEEELNFETLEEFIDVACGRKSSQLVLKDITYLDVFSGTWIDADIAIHKGRIAGIGNRGNNDYCGEKEINFKGRFIVPGFIDSHVHIESTCLIPQQFEQAVLPRGTTAAIIDPHEISNVLGEEGLKYFLDCALQSTMDLYVMLSSCVPATNHLETSGAILTSTILEKYKNHPSVLGLAEMMNFPGVIFKDKDVLCKTLLFQNSPIDGHSPMLRGKDLNAYLMAGIMTCHECISSEEASEKIARGMQILIREGSVAKNLNDLYSVITEMSSPKVSLCTDDRNPADILDEGHMDYLIRSLIKKGVSPALAFRCASWSTAQTYGLKRKGAIAPGYDADIVILNNINEVTVEEVIKGGRFVTKWVGKNHAIPKINVTSPDKNSICCTIPTVDFLKIKGSTGVYRVIELIPQQIITRTKLEKIEVKNSCVEIDINRDLLKISVLERYGNDIPISLGLVNGFGLKQGALGSSVCHDSHNIVVVGANEEDMVVCMHWIKEHGGGFVVAQNGEVIAGLPLPIAGLMSQEPMENIYKQLKDLRVAAAQLGCPLQEPFLQLAFLCLPVIPELKITDKGIVDVNKFDFVALQIP